MIIDLNFQVCKKRLYTLHGKVKTEALGAIKRPQIEKHYKNIRYQA